MSDLVLPLMVTMVVLILMVRSLPNQGRKNRLIIITITFAFYLAAAILVPGLRWTATVMAVIAFIGLGRDYSRKTDPQNALHEHK